MPYSIRIGSDSAFSYADLMPLRQGLTQHGIAVDEGHLGIVRESIEGAEALGWLLLHFADASYVAACEILIKQVAHEVKGLIDKGVRRKLEPIIEIDTPDMIGRIVVPRSEDYELRVTITAKMSELYFRSYPKKQQSTGEAKPQLYSGEDESHIYLPDSRKLRDYNSSDKTFGPEKDDD